MLDLNRPKTRRFVRPRLGVSRSRQLGEVLRAGRTRRRVFGRLRSPVKGEIPFAFRRPQAGTLYFAGAQNGSLERSQASQPVSIAKGIPLFESTGADDTKTVTDKNLGFRRKNVHGCAGRIN
jgi:hypothetical protein